MFFRKCTYASLVNSADEGPEVFLSILGSCYTTLDAKLFGDAATLLPVKFEPPPPQKKHQNSTAMII